MTKLTEQIQRYNVVHMPPKGERTMQPFEHGMWVRTTDHLEALARLSEQQEWPTDAECRADAPGGPLAQRTPATVPAPQSTERMHSAAEIERAMRDTPELGNPARNYKDVDRLIKRVLARLSAREQPSKEQPVI